LIEKKNSPDYDPLDMANYRIEQLPKREKSGFERRMAQFGGPIAILTFLLLLLVVKIPFLDNIDPTILGKRAAERYQELGAVEFSRTNVAMLAIFASAIVLWITEAIPHYLTSLMVR